MTYARDSQQYGERPVVPSVVVTSTREDDTSSTSTVCSSDTNKHLQRPLLQLHL